jgi:starch synthase (maltosyl-transferring)
LPVRRKASKLREVLKAGRTVFDFRRVIIEGVEPCVDGGRFPAKRSVGQDLTVEADIFTDGHDKLAAVLRHRHLPDGTWYEIPMEPETNDRWSATFTVTELGCYEYTIEAWIDHFASWLDGLEKKVDADQPVDSELLEGAELARQAAERATADDRRWLEKQAAILADASQSAARLQVALDPRLAEVMGRHPDRSNSTATERALPVLVDPERSSFGAWYEMFPRSCSSTPEQHGTFRDCEDRLSYVAGMGFDVLYLPPVHPIGRTHRKGPNNDPVAQPGDTGSPWGIGAAEGGHTAVHPELGSLADFDRLVARAGEHGLEVALDIAYQCSPDHPWVKEHPEWFTTLPDGTIAYAENPPKKYQDIYPLNFDNDPEGIRAEMLRVVLFWVKTGVKIFRVDNPHTKPIDFWHWLIWRVKAVDPDVLFLAEAFTRPAIMHGLGRIGFTQSYTYFTWRTNARELREYCMELVAAADHMRPSLWPNTPDILHETLQRGGPAMFKIRAILASMLSPSWGIYAGYELYEHVARAGAEEYLDNEKYQLRPRPWAAAERAGESLAPFITRLNAIRQENPALHWLRNLCFHDVDNEAVLCWSKRDLGSNNTVLVVCSLDSRAAHWANATLDMPALGFDWHERLRVQDQLTGAEFVWGQHNPVRLDPFTEPAHIFTVQRNGDHHDG